MRQIATVQTSTNLQAANEDISVKRLMAAMEAFMTADFDDEVIAQLVQTHTADHARRIARIEAIRDKAIADADAWQKQNLDNIQQHHDRDTKGAQDKLDAAQRDARAKSAQAATDLQNRWTQGLAQIQAPIVSQNRSNGQLLDWNDPGWKTWLPSKHFVSQIRFGQMQVDLYKTRRIPGPDSQYAGRL